MGIVKPRQAYYGYTNKKVCKRCNVFLRRLYVRDVYYEDAQGKRHERIDTYDLTQKRIFAPIGWWCPSCNRITFDGQDTKDNKANPQDSTDIKCRECKSTNTVFRKERGRSKQYQCRDCSAYFSIKDNETEKVTPESGVTSAETCPECGAKVPNPDSLSELTCQGCGEQFAC